MKIIKAPRGPDYEAIVKAAVAAAVAKVAEEKGGRARAYTVDAGKDGKFDVGDEIELNESGRKKHKEAGRYGYLRCFFPKKGLWQVQIDSDTLVLSEHDFAKRSGI